ncbi:MAG: hypothetical protein TECD_00539 [Hyphomicrobiaceae bacterium hypho_1]
MAGANPVREDDSLLSQLDRTLYKYETLLALISGFAVFSLMILAVINVGGRNAFSAPLPGYIDWIEQIMPIIAFIGISYCQRLGGHIRMDILVGQIRGRLLWFVEAIGVFFMLLLVLVMMWGSWEHFTRSFDYGAPLWSRDSSLDIRLPLWPAKLLAPVAFAFIALRLMLQLIAYCKAFINNEKNPVAVPMIEDAATVAANEAASVSAQQTKT